MFCALNGATDTPRRASRRHSPATITDFPASDVQPATRKAGAGDGEGVPSGLPGIT
ncbi:hypothetical protein [uncultured Corynebacterium sp.]|uniref:hypothetical protein n=1 Tax=uncultured Corynebacterium sp. TaxID=159447 RepID=UPI002624CD91|nr:hypothetical protein [uncultured Corynebacterium sp.]